MKTAASTQNPKRHGHAIEHLENIITFLPYMAVVDSFQHWVYTHPEAAKDPANCDAAWDKLWLRYIPDIDWNGYEEARQTGWHRKPHIFGAPFYYIEYGMASIGALQVWRNSLNDSGGRTRKIIVLPLPWAARKHYLNYLKRPGLNSVSTLTCFCNWLN